MDFSIMGILFLALTLCLTSTQSQFVCPDPNDIIPCSCVSDEYPLLICTNIADQILLDKAFAATRAANNVTGPNDRLDLDSFLYSSFQIATSFDLTPMARTDFHRVDMEFHEHVAIVSGTNSTDEIDIAPLRFGLEHLWITQSGLNDTSVAEFLKFIEPESPRALWFLKGKAESVPDLTPFVNLENFDLSYNQVTKVGGGQFRKNNKMNDINLYQNQISQIGEDAFLFENGASNDPLRFGIWLDGNSLNDDRIHENARFDSMGRNTWLGLGDNRFEFISAEKFEKFLMADPMNAIFGIDNPWVCDERMKWLKDQREDYEPRVFGLFCTNDPGNTVFNSTMIP